MISNFGKETPAETSAPYENYGKTTRFSLLIIMFLRECHTGPQTLHFHSLQVIQALSFIDFLYSNYSLPHFWQENFPAFPDRSSTPQDSVKRADSKPVKPLDWPERGSSQVSNCQRHWICGLCMFFFFLKYGLYMELYGVI